jgi:P27 family predicted phage terminase small subunit
MAALHRSPRPPADLSAEAKKWWSKLHGMYVLDGHHLLLVEELCRALDRLRQSQEVLRKDGVVSVDSKGNPKAHPATILERDSRTALLKICAQLNLDAAAALPPGVRKTRGM